jgi:hypothetical protein
MDHPDLPLQAFFFARAIAPITAASSSTEVTSNASR